MSGSRFLTTYVWGGAAVCVICNVLLCAQSNTGDVPKQEPSAAPSHPSTVNDQATSPVRLMKMCSGKNPPPCLMPPRPVFAPDPDYSDEARKAKYEGTCVLRVIVGADGKTHNIRVARMLGQGLDEKAIDAVKQWRFEPATKDGQPVAVEVNISVSFRLNAQQHLVSPFNNHPTISGIIVSPVSAGVPTSGQQQFSATVPGTTNSTVVWSVSGFGCVSSACGTISADGLYTAPLNIPNPATIVVKATLASDASRSTSAIVNIQSSSSH